MKKRTILLLTAVLTFSSQLLLAQSLSNANTYTVTVSDYCDFLNSVAADDPHDLYSGALSEDPSTPIERVGKPGKYQYFVLNGCENNPIEGLTWLDEARYCNWLENGEESGAQGIAGMEGGVYVLNGTDENNVAAASIIISPNPNTTYYVVSSYGNTGTSLGNSDAPFIIGENDATETLSMLPSPGAVAKGGSEIADIAPGVSALVVGMVTGDRIASEVSEREAAAPATRELTLQDFRTAYRVNPNASRLVVHENGTIQSREVATSSVFSITNPEDVTITRALRAAFKKAYPDEDADKFLPGSGKHETKLRCPPLSAEKLKNFFRSIDEKITSDVAKRSAEHNQLTLEELYERANEFANKAQEARMKRSILRLNVAKKEELLAQAEELLKQETAKFEEVNPDKTTLGKFSHHTEAVSDVLGDVNVLGVSPAAPLTIASKVADSLNRRIESAQMKSAREAVKKATKNLENARQALQQHEVRDQFDLQAREAEEAAQKRQEEDLFSEAKKISSTRDGAKQWFQRIQTFDQDLQSLINQKEQTLQSFYEALQVSEEHAINARTEASIARHRWDTAEQTMIEAETAAKEAQQAYDQLEDQLHKLQARANLAQERQNIKEAQQQCLAEKTNAQRVYQQALSDSAAAERNFKPGAKSLEDIALAAEADALQKFEEWSNQEEQLLRAIRRSYDRSNAYRKAFMTLWPEEATRNGIAEIHFSLPKKENPDSAENKKISVSSAEERKNDLPPNYSNSQFDQSAQLVSASTQAPTNSKENNADIIKKDQPASNNRPTTQGVQNQLTQNTRADLKTSSLLSVVRTMQEEMNATLAAFHQGKIGEAITLDASFAPVTPQDEIAKRAHDAFKTAEMAHATKGLHQETQQALQDFYEGKDASPKEEKRATDDSTPQTDHERLQEATRGAFVTTQTAHVAADAEREMLEALQGIEGLDLSEFGL